MKITDDLIRKGESGNGGWNREQLALIDVPWPPVKGWRTRVHGHEISDEDAARFVALKGAKRRGKRLMVPYHNDLFAFQDRNKPESPEDFANRIYENNRMEFTERPV